MNSKVYTNYKKKHIICTNFINFNKLFKKKLFRPFKNRNRKNQIEFRSSPNSSKSESANISVEKFLQFVNISFKSTLYIGIRGLHRLFERVLQIMKLIIYGKRFIEAFLR